MAKLTDAELMKLGSDVVELVDHLRASPETASAPVYASGETKLPSLEELAELADSPESNAWLDDRSFADYRRAAPEPKPEPQAGECVFPDDDTIGATVVSWGTDTVLLQTKTGARKRVTFPTMPLPDVAELVKRLRQLPNIASFKTLCEHVTEAADTIERLARERDEIREWHDRLIEERDDGRRANDVLRRSNGILCEQRDRYYAEVTRLQGIVDGIKRVL